MVALVPKQTSSYNIPASASISRTSISRYGEDQEGPGQLRGSFRGLPGAARHPSQQQQAALAAALHQSRTFVPLLPLLPSAATASAAVTPELQGRVHRAPFLGQPRPGEGMQGAQNQGGTWIGVLTCQSLFVPVVLEELLTVPLYSQKGPNWGRTWGILA